MTVDWEWTGREGGSGCCSWLLNELQLHTLGEYLSEWVIIMGIHVANHITFDVNAIAHFDLAHFSVAAAAFNWPLDTVRFELTQ